MPNLRQTLATTTSQRSYKADIDIDMPASESTTHVRSGNLLLADIPEEGEDEYFVPQDPNCPRPPMIPPIQNRATKSESDLEPYSTPASVSQRTGSDEVNDEIDPTGSPQDKAVKEDLLALLENKITRNYSVISFIEAVWGHRREDLREPKEGYWIPRKSLNAYAGSEYHKRNGHRDIKVEHTAYKPLTEIFLSIIKKVEAAYGETDPHLHASFVNMLDHAVDGLSANFKPDFLWSWLLSSEAHSWPPIALCGELEKTPLKPPIVDTVVDITKVTKSRMSHTTHLLFKDFTSSATPSASTSGVKRKADALIPTNSSPRPPKRRRLHRCNSTHYPISERPQLRTDVSSSLESQPSATSDVNFPNPRHISSAPFPTRPTFLPSAALSTPSIEMITAKELQVIRYINELGSHGIRSYATGFLVVNYEISLWYIDRMGVIGTVSFNFVKEPHLLVYFIAAVTRAPTTSLGFASFLKFPPPGKALTAETFSTYKNVDMVAPVAHDVDGKELKNLEFSLQVSENRPIVPTYGAVGRATVVFPVKAAKSTGARVAACHISQGNLVAKVSWQSKWRRGEDDIIRKIYASLKASEKRKRMLRNITDMRLSMTRTMGEMNLPRAKMQGLCEVDERVCRVLVLREYLPLTAVKSVKEFKKVFIDVVKGHHAVYETSDVLHRDISTGNIMFYYRDGTKFKVPTGVLGDWDLAKKIEPPKDLSSIVKDLMRSDTVAEAIPSSRQLKQLGIEQPIVRKPSGVFAATDTDSKKQAPRYRTGTGPFMALDLLLYKHTPQHLYRHDLESFFWVLVWFTRMFDPDTHTLGVIPGWLGNNLKSIGDTKAKIVDSYSEFTPFRTQGHETYAPLRETWVMSLYTDVIQPVYEPYRLFKSKWLRLLEESSQAEAAKKTTASSSSLEADDRKEMGGPSEGTTSAAIEGSDDGTEGEKEDSEGKFEDDEEEWYEELASAAPLVKNTPRSDDVWKEVVALVEKRESILTFESFMKCLNFDVKS
ncbi:hypothetical protein BXZ70DRAFT_1011293 [Cristinia sonorae]|uniref:Fungal-type protein kinase domain-containing protein n=1 Tax=Cristinia sonorae TaxID=1940300 RepID=A0A8K0UHS8_9AGAR|nr:hypothetical protein BXZ70DRAFT_1011293 [Cristinia sonorae]